MLAGAGRARGCWGDVASRSGRGCVTAIQGGYFGDQQPGQREVQDMETRCVSVLAVHASPCTTSALGV